jgi:hypothetical protein
MNLQRPRRGRRGPSRVAQAAVMLAFAGLVPARAQSARSPGADFAGVARAVSLALHSRPRHRQLLGASQLLIRGADPLQAGHARIALFDLRSEPTAAERRRVRAALRHALPAPWQLVAQRRSKYGEQQTWVYARPDGRRLRTLVCRLERGQATLVMARADPQAVLDSLEGHGIVIWSHKSLVRGLWSGLGDGSGFGPGIAFHTPSGPLNLLQVHGSAQVTYERYLKTTLGFRFDPTGGDMRTFSVDVTGQYRDYPEVDFFGQGPNSPTQRTMFDLQDRGVAATFAVRPARIVRFGAGEEYSGTRIFGGEGEGYANAQTAFSLQATPGLARGANLLSSFAYLQIDTRDYPFSPHSGVYLRLAAADNNGAGHSGFGYWHYRADARGYLPLTSTSDVLAARVLSIWNIAKAGEAVPFFRLARLGDSSTLRGYRPYRFYGRNAVESSLEYRHYFDDDIGAFLFGDVGQVYDTGSELTRANMRATWGAGLLFNDNRRRTFFKIFFGVTRDEGHRWFLTLGPTF